MAIDCTSDWETMFRLLERVKATYESNDFDGLLVQEVHEPKPFERGIPTLNRKVYRKPTPMLKARFKFAGTWTNAGAGHTWLSVPDMEAAWGDKKILEQIRICQKYWQASAPQKFEWNRLSLFGIEAEQYEETYLVWSEDESKEPEIYLYSGHEEKRFQDPQDYLEFLVS